MATHQHRRFDDEDEIPPKKIESEFFKFNLAHIVIVGTWLITFAYGYGSLNTRVSANEIVLAKLQVDRTAIIERASEDQKRIATEMATLNSKLSTIGNDVEWLKKNTK